MKELRSAFESRGLLLSAAVSASKRVIDVGKYPIPYIVCLLCYNLVQPCGFLPFFFLMALIDWCIFFSVWRPNSVKELGLDRVDGIRLPRPVGQENRTCCTDVCQRRRHRHDSQYGKKQLVKAYKENMIEDAVMQAIHPVRGLPKFWRTKNIPAYLLLKYYRHS